MRVTEVTSKVKPFALGWLDNVLTLGGRDLGTPTSKWGAIYADSITVDTLAGTLAGQTWEYLSGDMTIDAKSGSDRTLFVLNSGAGQASLNVQKDIIVGGLVDGVDISAHAANVNAHHNQVHALVGSDHTASGLTTGHVVRASGASAFAWAQLQHNDLGGVTANQHHNQIHNITGSDHTISASQYSVVGATSTNVLGILATTNDGSANFNTILRSSAAGNLRLSSLTAPLINTASGNLTLTPASDVILSNDKALRSSIFVSGFAGSGFELVRATDASLELDRLIVRGTMSVYELLINQIRATNGSLFVSSSGKVATVTDTAPYVIVTDGDHGFAVGDLIRAQRFTGVGVYQSNMQVTVVTSTTQFSATLSSGNAPAAGMEFVRLGNVSNSARRGAVYLTADDSGAPFMDITDGVASFADWSGAAKTKVRVGNLSGISDPDLSPTGYGMYSTNAYLKGSLVAASGVVVANSTGIAVRMAAASDFVTLNSYRLVDAADAEIGGVYGIDVATGGGALPPPRVSVAVRAMGKASRNSEVQVSAVAHSDSLAAETILSASKPVDVANSRSFISLRSGPAIDIDAKAGDITMLSRVVIKGRGATSATSALNVTDSADSSILFVRNDGNVGIGTTSPGHTLHATSGASNTVRTARFGMTGGIANTEYTVAQFDVSGASAQSPTVTISSNNTVGLKFTHTASFTRAFIDNNFSSATSLAFGLRGSELMTILNTGNVGIGTTSPSARLDVKAGSASTIGLIVDTATSPTANAQEWRINGSMVARMNITNTTRQLAIEPFGNGSSIGSYIFLGRNSDGTTPATGFLRIQNGGGVSHRLWPDVTGVLRIWTGGDPTFANDGSGTVVGTQTSMAEAKHIGTELSTIENVLDRIATGAESVKRFVYKSGSFNNEQFEGVITDLAPHYGMDRDADHPQGKSLNEVNILGDLLRAVNYLRQRIERMEKI